MFAYTGGLGLYGTNNANSVANHGVQIGYLSVAGDYAIAIGKDTVSAGEYAISIGYKAEASGTSDLAIGYGATASGGSAVKIGGTSNGRHANNGTTAVGYDAGVYDTATGTFDTLIGYDCTTLYGAGNNVGVGAFILFGTDATYTTAIGPSAKGYAPRGTAIGTGARSLAGHDDSTAIGSAVRTIATDTVTLGVSNTNKISFGQWTPAVATPAASHTLDVTISGSVYKILLST